MGWGRTSRGFRRRWFHATVNLMLIQANPEVFSSSLPIHTVTQIDKNTGTVTLSGSDGTSFEVPLGSWGPFECTQPLIGSQVQLLPE
jgi:hypothetical protein